MRPPSSSVSQTDSARTYYSKSFRRVRQCACSPPCPACTGFATARLAPTLSPCALHDRRIGREVFRQVRFGLELIGTFYMHFHLTYLSARRLGVHLRANPFSVLL